MSERHTTGIPGLGEHAIRFDAAYNSLAVGKKATATGDESTSLGTAAVASGAGAVALGLTASAAGASSVAVGYAANASNSYTVAIGTNCTSNVNYAVGVGYNTSASGATEPLAIGYLAQALSSGKNVAIGSRTIAYTDDTIVGYRAGNGLTTGSASNTFVGSDAGYAPNNNNTNKTTTATGNVFIGYQTGGKSTSQYNNTVAVGYRTLTDGASSGAFGDSAQSRASSAFAFGNNSVAEGVGSSALGSGANASGASSTSVGRYATTTHAGGVAIGCDNSGNGAATGATNEIAIGVAAHTTKTYGGRKKHVTSKGATDYTLVDGDHIVVWTTGTQAATLPTAASQTGREYVIKNLGSGVITVGTTSSQTIDGASTVTLNQYDVVTVISDGTNWFKI